MNVSLSDLTSSKTGSVRPGLGSSALIACLANSPFSIIRHRTESHPPVNDCFILNITVVYWRFFAHMYPNLHEKGIKFDTTRVYCLTVSLQELRFIDFSCSGSGISSRSDTFIKRAIIYTDPHSTNTKTALSLRCLQCERMFFTGLTDSGGVTIHLFILTIKAAQQTMNNNSRELAKTWLLSVKRLKILRLLTSSSGQAKSVFLCITRLWFLSSCFSSK